MTWPFAWLATVTRKGPLGWGLASLACFIAISVPDLSLWPTPASPVDRIQSNEWVGGSRGRLVSGTTRGHRVARSGPHWTDNRNDFRWNRTRGNWSLSGNFRPTSGRVRHPAAGSRTVRSGASLWIPDLSRMVVTGSSGRQRPPPADGSCNSSETLREPRNNPGRLHASLGYHTRRTSCPQWGRNREG